MPKDKDRIAEALGPHFRRGLFLRGVRVPREMSAVEEAAISLTERFLAEGRGARFKAEVRRAEKSFPLTSYEIACRIGDILTGPISRADRGRA